MFMKKCILPIAVLLVLAAAGLGIFLLVPAKPEYCWLVFGPEGKLRVLVRLQGNKIYIDRGRDGAFLGPEEYLGRIGECRDVVIADPDGQATYTITGVDRLVWPDSPNRKSLSVDTDIAGLLRYRQYCEVELAASPQNANEAHFHGPLTVEAAKVLWKLPSGQVLERGDKPTTIQVNVGTMNAEKGCWVVVRTQQKDDPAFRKGVHPVVDVEFPPKNPEAASIKRRYPLDEPC